MGSARTGGEARLERLIWMNDVALLDSILSDLSAAILKPPVKDFSTALSEITGKSPLYLEPFVGPLIGTFNRYQLNTKLRVCHFIAQIAHESQALSVFKENLNYSTEALISKFSRERISTDEARKYGRNKDHPADQIGISNCIYGGEWGVKNLGNVEAGDGWRFIGRGSIQLTGRLNHFRYTEYCQCIIGLAAPDFTLNPHFLESTPWNIDSAGWYWTEHRKINDEADADNLVAVTRAVNGGTVGLDERRKYLDKAKAVL